MITNKSTSLHLQMTEQTYNRRLNQLIIEVENHTQRDELLKLMQEQLIDDTYVVEHCK